MNVNYIVILGLTFENWRQKSHTSCLMKHATKIYLLGSQNWKYQLVRQKKESSELVCYWKEYKLILNTKIYLQEVCLTY